MIAKLSGSIPWQGLPQQPCLQLRQKLLSRSLPIQAGAFAAGRSYPETSGYQAEGQLMKQMLQAVPAGESSPVSVDPKLSRMGATKGSPQEVHDLGC